MKRRIIPFILTCILIGAHFMRDGNRLLTLLSIIFPLLLLIKQRWVLIVSQIFAYIGAWLWVGTAIEIAEMRMLFNEDWTRMAIILGTVAAFSVWSGVLLNSKKVKENYLAPVDAQ